MNKWNEKIKEIKSKEFFKDKKGRAIIELSIYFVFFLVLLVFVRVSSYKNSVSSDISNFTSFINEIDDNYEYNMDIVINDENYNYHGKVLGNNKVIIFTTLDEEKYYYVMNNKYYLLDNEGNYILCNEEDVYSYLTYSYLNIKNIKTFIKSGEKKGNTYHLKVSDIVLNNQSAEEVLITLDEENKKINIDYTNLLKVVSMDINNCTVEISFSNINNILSLEE